MSTLAEKLKARKAATQSSPVATPAPQPVVEAPPVVVEPVVEVKSVPGPLGIIPPDAPGGDKVPEKAEGVVPPERPEGIMATLAKRRATKAQPTEAKAEVQPTQVVVEPTPEPVAAPPVKIEYVNVPPVVAPEAALQPVVEKPTAPASAELTLFVDCFPEKAPFDTLRALEDEIAARTPSLLEHLRKTSPKDVPEGTMDLGEVLFGRGYSTLSASFAVKPISGAWTVSTLGPASSKVLEVLLPKATFVVRGRR
jgi:hypothetical protein